MPKSLFYKIYFSVIIAFALLLTIGLILLSGWLGNYEASKPEKIVESIIENHLATGKITELRDEFFLELSPFESNENIKPFYEENLKGKEFSYASISKKGGASTLSYGITADGKRIMNLHLKKNGNKYAVYSSEFAKDLYSSVTITMPYDAKIFINGKQLEDNLRKNLELPKLPQKYVSENLKAKQTYTIEKLLCKNVTITCHKNFNIEQYASGDFSVYSNIDKDITDFAEAAVKTYACYLQKDADISALSSVLATDTAFYKNVISSYITYVAEHTSYKFDDVEISEHHCYSENLYSCRVKMKHVMVSKTGEEHLDYFDKNVYVYKSGDTLKIIDMQNFS